METGLNTVDVCFRMSVGAVCQVVHVYMDVRTSVVQGSSLCAERVCHLLRSHADNFEPRKVSAAASEERMHTFNTLYGVGLYSQCAGAAVVSTLYCHVDVLGSVPGHGEFG